VIRSLPEADEAARVARGAAPTSRQADGTQSRPYKRKEPGLAAGLRCMKLSVKLRS